MTNISITNNFENATNLKDLLAIPNASTGGFFWLGMLVMMWAIIVIAFLPFGFEVAIISSSFIILIAGLFVTYLGLVSWGWLMVFLGIILFMIFYMVWQKGKTTS